MADKSPHRSTAKKAGKTLKEKRAAKKLKRAPTTGAFDAVNRRDHR
jgi:hypothetical protein